MGKKAEVGTPKYLANKMKAKGLQKLRWYCQMCQKQCRDENGFKCHSQSESHQRQLLLFADNSKQYIDEFSHEFATGYLEILKRQFGTKRVAANRVYQEYISDRNHLHMNATRWVTLTGFVKWLGRLGKCIVDETEKGWFITYIDRDPETIARQEKLLRREKMAKDDLEREMEFLEKQVKRGQELDTKTTENQVDDNLTPEEILNIEERDKIKLNIKPKMIVIAPGPSTSKIEEESTQKRKHTEEKPHKNSKMKKTALDEIMEFEEKSKEIKNRKDYWLTEGIIVKVITKSLGENYYNKKGVVREVIDKYSAVVSMLDAKHKIKLDQAHLETVIPAVGKLVKVVNGAYRGSKAVISEVHPKKFCLTIEIDSGPLKGRKLNNVQYEDVSKFHIE